MASSSGSRLTMVLCGLGGLAASGLAFVACKDDPAVPAPPDASPGLVTLDAGRADTATPGDGGDADVIVDPCRDPGPGLCSPTALWGEPTSVLPSAGGPTFAAISLDELHLAYYETADGGAGEARVSDRASASGAFEPGRAVGIEYDGDGFALSPDGRELVGMIAGLPRLQTRPTGSGPFGAPTTEVFLFGADGERFRTPVLGPSGTLWLGRVDPSPETYAISLVTMSDGFYRRSPVVEGADLLATPGRPLHPTGISADLRTLFYYDEAAKVAKAAFRPAPGCVFTSFVELGNRPRAQPNAACTALYYADPVTRAPTRVARK